MLIIDIRKSRERILNIAQKTRKEKEEERNREEERSLIFQKRVNKRKVEREGSER